jgi:hypothetical protein
MAERPDGSRPDNTPDGIAETKWAIAVGAVEALTAELDGTVRFGLELFPQDPDGECVPLGESLDGARARNASCEGGQLEVAPTIDAHAAIDAAIDPETTGLCSTTPIGAALETATAALAAVAVDGRAQHVVFVGDGKDTCDDDLVLDTIDAMAAAGLVVHVVAFDDQSGGIDVRALDDMACAAGTATGFPASCELDRDGHYRAPNDGEPRFFLAEDGAALSEALRGLAGDVCCGCEVE